MLVSFFLMLLLEFLALLRGGFALLLLTLLLCGLALLVRGQAFGLHEAREVGGRSLASWALRAGLAIRARRGQASRGGLARRGGAARTRCGARTFCAADHGWTRRLERRPRDGRHMHVRTESRETLDPTYELEPAHSAMGVASRVTRDGHDSRGTRTGA